MRRGVHFPIRQDSAHWVEERGARDRYGANHLHRIGDPARSSRLQTSSRPVGVAVNLPALQQFGAPMLLNAAHAIPSRSSSGPSSKWRRLDGLDL